MTAIVALIDGSGGVDVSGSAGAIYPWWSFSKTAIAACAVRLASRKVIALDASLDGRRYTLRQLLQHRSGLPDYGSLADYHAAVATDEEPWPEDRLLEAVHAERPTLIAGERFVYSNIGYLRARHVLEQATGEDLGTLVRQLLCEPLGLGSVQLARTREEMASTAWGDRAPYHPGWVYHGLLTGTATDACRLWHGIATGALLEKAERESMLELQPIGGAIEGRPWARTGYGLGVMGGQMDEAGNVVGHSGVGPGSVCAVYRFVRLATPCTIAAFSDEPTEDGVEWRAVRAALALQGR